VPELRTLREGMSGRRHSSGSGENDKKTDRHSLKHMSPFCSLGARKEEEMGKSKVMIVFSGGLITHVYSTSHPREIEAQVLDFDAAKNHSYSAFENLAARLADIKKRHRLITSDTYLGLHKESE
jgi:hypothetical protein